MLNWESQENHLFLNPRFPFEQAQELRRWVIQVEREFRAHLFLLTSGTLAQSAFDLKWVALSKEAVLASAAAVNHHLGCKQNDVWVHALPEFHVGGLGIWARSFLSGCGVSKLEKWAPDPYVRRIEEVKGSLSALVPTQVHDLVSLQLKCPPTMRAVLVGGGAMTLTLYRAARSLGWPLLPTYGMTETSSQVATASLGTLSTVEVERLPPLEVLPHLEVRETEGGFLKIKGKSLLTSYIRCHGHSSFQHDPKKEGWFVSQDRGRKLGDSLEILGRAGEFVKIGGESVEMGRLNEILEQVRSQLSYRSDLALLAVPDERLGHAIHLLAERQVHTQRTEELVHCFNGKVLGFEKIRAWHPLEKIPRNEMGKLLPKICLRTIGKA